MSHYLKDQFANLARRSKKLLDFEVADVYEHIMQTEQENYSRIVESEPEYAHERAFDLAQLGFELNAAQRGQLVLPLRPLFQGEYAPALVGSLIKTGLGLTASSVIGGLLYFMAPSAIETLRNGASTQAMVLDVGVPVYLGLTMIASTAFTAKFLKEAFNNAMKNTLALCVPQEWTKILNEHGSQQLTLKTALQHSQVERIRYTPMH